MHLGLHDAYFHLSAGTVSAINTAVRVVEEMHDKYPHLKNEFTQSSVIQGPTGKILQVIFPMGTITNVAIKSVEIPDDKLIQSKYLDEIISMDRILLKNGFPSILISETSIEHLYHINSHSESQQQSLFKYPLDILREGKSTLTRLARELIDAKEKKTSKTCNVMMLKEVNQIREFDLAICTALLGGFMEQQKVQIPLVKSQLDQTLALAVKGPASVGVWALSSLKYENMRIFILSYHDAVESSY